MKLINHVLDIRRLIQQAFDNRFSRMGLRADAPVPADQLSDSDHRQRRQKLDDIFLCLKDLILCRVRSFTKWKLHA